MYAYTSAGGNISDGRQDSITAKPSKYQQYLPPPPKVHEWDKNTTLATMCVYVDSLSRQWKLSIARYALWSISWAWPRES